MAFRGWWALCLLAAFGCSPKLGDKCKTNTDCSVQLNRQCDLASLGGYCTIQNCVPGGCKGEGYCVRFDPDQLRLATTWCMAKCRRGCRSGYRCVTVEELNAENCGMCISEYRRLLALGDQRRKDDPSYQDWVDVTTCMNNEPRLAEMLDNKPNGAFCDQELPDMSMCKP